MVAQSKMRDFKEAWMHARHVAYSSMPEVMVHLIWVLANLLAFMVLLQVTTLCKWLSWIPSLGLAVAFFGIMRVAEALENPFGFDDDDIPVGQVGEHLDEDISLIMFYASLDEVSGENLYRSLMHQDHVHLDHGRNGVDRGDTY